MQATTPSTRRPAAHGNMVGYLCMLVLLIFAIALLALESPSSTSSPGSIFYAAPAAAPLTSPGT